MVIPLGAPEVAHLVDHCIEPVIHCLWLLSFVEGELTEFSLDRLALGDLGHLVPFVCRFEDVPIFFSIYKPCTLLYSSRHKHARSIEVAWELKMPNLGGLVQVVVLVAHLWCVRSKLNNIPYAFVESG
jgi:hypothetical protein